MNVDKGTRKGTRKGGRAKRITVAKTQDVLTKPYITRKISPIEILDDDELAIIEKNADILLAKTGMDFVDDPEILSIFAKAGAKVEGTRVRFEEGFCRSVIQATTPREYVQHARNPEKSVKIGGRHTVLGPSWGPPFIHNLDEGRRYANFDDFQNLIKIHHSIPHLHHSGGIVCEPVDVPAGSRHLDMLYAHIRYCDRPYMGAFIGEERAKDAVEMMKIVFGAEFVANNAVLYNVSNTNAPLVMDANMSGSLKVYAQNNQPVACTPWVLAGAMSPCTVAGTLTQVLAEAMACLTLVQLIKPGAPALMGSFASTISMQNGAPTFGTPEAAKMVLASGQLARRLGVPLHTVGTLSASKLPDAQSAQESTWNLMMAMFAGANYINHATGWLEGGLVTGYEKTMIDADLCGKAASFFNGIDMSANGLALDALIHQPPGEHFLGSEHTQQNFKSAFYTSSNADNNSYEQWASEGKNSAAIRANLAWKEALASYQDPHLDAAIDEELKAYVTRRKEMLEGVDYF